MRLQIETREFGQAHLDLERLSWDDRNQMWWLRGILNFPNARPVDHGVQFTLTPDGEFRARWNLGPFIVGQTPHVTTFAYPLYRSLTRADETREHLQAVMDRVQPLLRELAAEHGHCLTPTEFINSPAR